MMQPRHLVQLPLLLSALTACPPRPVDFGQGGAPATANDLMTRIDQIEAEVVSIKGDAKLSVSAKEGKGAVSLFIAVAEPAYVHVEQLNFFGQPETALTTDGQIVGLYDGQRGQFYRGPATSANLGRFLPVVIPPRELTHLLLGRVPRLRDAKAEMQFDDKEGLFSLTLTKGEVVQELKVKPPSYRIVRSRVRGLHAYDVDCSDIVNEVSAAQNKAPLQFPKLIAIRSDDANVELSYKTVTYNEAFDATLFDLSAPEGTPVIEVDGQGVPRQSASDAGAP